jgi:hypothetical protein
MHVQICIYQCTFYQSANFLGPINKYDLAEAHDNSRMKGLFEAHTNIFSCIHISIYKYVCVYKYVYINIHSIRVPIFLGPINKYDLAEAHDNSRMKGLFEAHTNIFSCIHISIYTYVCVYKYVYINIHSIRVPIFLGPINKYELAEADDNSRMKGLYDAQQEGRNVDKEDPESPVLVFLLCLNMCI